MIQAEELYRTLQQRPFHPFRIHLEDGKFFDIRHPEINVVGTTFFVIGIPVPNDPDPVAQRTVEVPLTSIRGWEHLPETGSRPG